MNKEDMQCPYGSFLCDQKSCNHYSIHEKTTSCETVGTRFDDGCPRCESINFSDFIKEEEMII